MSKTKPGGVPGYGSMRNPGGKLAAVLVADWKATLDQRAAEGSIAFKPCAYLIPTSSAGAWAPKNAAPTITQHVWTQERKPCRVQLVELDDARWAVIHSLTLSGGFIEEVTLAEAVDLEEFAAKHGEPSSYKDRRHPSAYFGVGPIMHKGGKERYVLGRAVRCFPVEGLAAGDFRLVEFAPEA